MEKVLERFVWPGRLVAPLSPSAKIAVVKLSCTVQCEVLDVELWRCSPKTLAQS